MKRSLVIACFITLGVAAGTVAGERFLSRRFTTHPSCRTTIPKAEYQTSSRSVSVTSISLAAITRGEVPQLELGVLTEEASLLETAPSPLALGTSISSELKPERGSTKIFQFRDPGLRIDHCAISRMAVTVNSDGHWTVSLRADQNPRELGAVSRAYNPALFLKQNSFVVAVRCFGAFQEPAFRRSPASGRPVLVEIGPIRFNVRSGQPYFLNATSNGELNESSNGVKAYSFQEAEINRTMIRQQIHEHFAQIDRVEIEFYYEGASVSPPTNNVTGDR